MDIEELLGMFGMGGAQPPPMGQQADQGQIPLPPPRPASAPGPQSPGGMAQGLSYMLAGPNGGQQPNPMNQPMPGPVPLPPPRPPQAMTGDGMGGGQMQQRSPLDELTGTGTSPDMPPIDRPGPAPGMPPGQPPAPPGLPPDLQAGGELRLGQPLPPNPPAAPPNVPLPPPRPPQAPQMAQQPVPLPPPRPPEANLPPNAQPTAGATPGAPMSLAPQSNGVPLPPPMPTKAPAAGYPETKPIDKTRQLMAGVGAGLSKINGPGKFASFARGAGQGMEGSEKNNQDQTKDNRAAQGQHFNQLSTSFKDMLAAQGANNQEAYRAAQAKYLNARADALQSGAGGSNAWQNTPYGRVLGLEKQLSSERDRELKVMQQQWKQNGTDPAAQGQQLQALEQKMEARKQQLYKATGVDPQQAEKIKSQGLTQQNPFDTKGMSMEQFNSSVPIGAWYTNSDGKLYQRTKPPEGQGAEQAKQQSTNEPNLDDQAAMTDTG